jgi:hypothetical protein
VEKIMKEKIYDYFICGDYEINGRIESCLICTCGKNEEHAKKVLEEQIELLKKRTAKWWQKIF